MPRILSLIFLLSLSCFAALPARVYLDSAYLVRGEVTNLTIETTGELTSIPKELLETEKYDLQEQGGFMSRKQNSFTYNYRFSLSSLHLGTHTIPSLELVVDGETFTTPPVEFEVRSSSSLEFKTVKIGDKDIKYAVAMLLPERDLYLGETVRSELKVYLPYDPSHFEIIDYGVPEHKRDGISAWRYQTDRRDSQPFLLPHGPAFSITYRSSAHAIKTGTVSLAPGNVRPVFNTIVTSNGFPTKVQIPQFLDIAKIERKSLPLPPGAPENFKGAVGQFSLGVEIVNQVRNSPSDPITTNLKIAGTGNLDNLEPPVLLAEEGDWKIYPATKKQREDERRYLSGTVEFTQILRPTSEQRDLPGFDFSYFDPVEKKYVTRTSDPIPLLVQTAANADLLPTPEDGGEKKSDGTGTLGKLSENAVDDSFVAPIPEENMGDVLGLIAPPYATSQIGATLWRYWQIIPALIVLALLSLALNRHLMPRLSPSPEKVRLRNAMKDLRDTKEPTSFLKKASLFCQRHLTASEHAALKEEVDGFRDDFCYNPGASQKDAGEVRAQLMKKLTEAAKTALPILLLSLCCFTDLHAETLTAEEAVTQPAETLEKEETVSAETLLKDAYQMSEEEDFSGALSLYLRAYSDGKIPADVLYNIGTCYVKMKEPGQAMLYYRRALLEDPQHKEAQQNMRYLERVHGSNVIQRMGMSKFLSNYSLTAFKTVLAVLLWAFIIAVLSLSLLYQRRARLTAWAAIFISGFLLPISVCCVLFYPNDGKFAPVENLAVVTTSKTATARTNASKTSNQVIKAPPGSIGKVLQQRGHWVYLEFANETRGWLSTMDLTMLKPNTTFSPVSPVEEASDL